MFADKNDYRTYKIDEIKINDNSEADVAPVATAAENRSLNDVNICNENVTQNIPDVKRERVAVSGSLSHSQHTHCAPLQPPLSPNSAPSFHPLLACEYFHIKYALQIYRSFILVSYSVDFALPMRWALSKKLPLRNATLRYWLVLPSSVLGRTCLMLSGFRTPYAAGIILKTTSA